MALFRKLLFCCHLAAGLSAGVVVLIMSVTGVALTYQRQMRYRADAGGYRTTPPQPGAAPLTPSALVAAVRSAQPDFAPATIVWRRADHEPVALTAGARTVYANPYTGAIHGEPQGGRGRSSATSCGSVAGCDRRPATSTGTTSSASGSRCRSPSSSTPAS